MPGEPRRLDAGHRILDDDTVERLLVHRDRRMQEQVRERLAARHLARAEDPAVEQVPQAGEAEREAHLLGRARACDAGREAVRLQRQHRLLHAGDRLQGRVAEALVGDRLHLLEEVVRQLAAELSLDDLEAGLQRQAHQAAHRLLDRPVEALRLQRAGEARVGQRLAVDQNAVAIEDDNNVYCRP